MISQRLFNLARTLDRHYREKRLTEEIFRLALAELCDLADRVEALEDSTAPPVPQLSGDLPPNVILLARKLHKGGVTLGHPDGGNAA